MIKPARFSKRPEGNSLADQRRHDLNRHRHDAISTDKLQGLTDRLVLLGMSTEQQKILLAQAQALDAQLETEINRIHGF